MYKALKSFCGKVSMKKGETKNINDAEIVNDLLNAGFIVEVEEKKSKIEPIIKKIEEEVKKPKTSRKKK